MISPVVQTFSGRCVVSGNSDKVVMKHQGESW